MLQGRTDLFIELYRQAHDIVSKQYVFHGDDEILEWLINRLNRVLPTKNMSLLADAMDAYIQGINRQIDNGDAVEAYHEEIRDGLAKIKHNLNRYSQIKASEQDNSNTSIPEPDLVSSDAYAKGILDKSPHQQCMMLLDDFKHRNKIIRDMLDDLGQTLGLAEPDIRSKIKFKNRK